MPQTPLYSRDNTYDKIPTKFLQRPSHCRIDVSTSSTLPDRRRRTKIAAGDQPIPLTPKAYETLLVRVENADTG